LAQPGTGGGGATSSANGSAGSGGGAYGPIIPPGSPFMLLNNYCINGNVGNSGSNNSGANTPMLNPTFAGSGVSIGQGNTPNYAYGNGGVGGGVNSNGDPGVQGIVIIWWGD